METTTPQTPPKRTRYYFDTEFIEDGSTIDLVSIGIVCEDGRTFYRQNADAKFEKAGDWVIRNVLAKLEHYDMRGQRSCTGVSSKHIDNAREVFCGDKCAWRKHYDIRNEAREFLDIQKYGKPEFWAYYADYDWVSFCQLFGTMMELPKGFPQYCNDLKQLCVSVGDPELPRFITDAEQHHALHDATEVAKRHVWLNAYAQKQAEK